MQDNLIKIINTTYKLIDFFPEGDPLKNKAKEKALSLLESFTINFDREAFVSLKKEKAISQFLDDVAVLEAYLTIAKQQSWINNVNFLILIKEYNTIKNQIHHQ